MNQLVIPMAADFLLFVLKAGVITLLATWFFKKTIVPLLNKRETQTTPE
ncbi:hypothetical protein ACFOUO_09745 [Salinithrix halophila]|uniref:Uncharacterized protein n=1 Tax=Salinithrix halophila TaxID=1485204 RepID=A0ABV8JJZ9_9BACL